MTKLRTSNAVRSRLISLSHIILMNESICLFGSGGASPPSVNQSDSTDDQLEPKREPGSPGSAMHDELRTGGHLEFVNRKHSPTTAHATRMGMTSGPLDDHVMFSESGKSSAMRHVGPDHHHHQQQHRQHHISNSTSAGTVHHQALSLGNSSSLPAAVSSPMSTAYPDDIYARMHGLPGGFYSHHGLKSLDDFGRL